jgi:hypothetical protein
MHDVVVSYRYVRDRHLLAYQVSVPERFAAALDYLDPYLRGFYFFGLHAIICRLRQQVSEIFFYI